ncbi:MAG: HPr family phosphocarrier protein [Candidatus Muiribacteriaceae bacterium]
MISDRVKIRNKLGLHARPASMIVDMAAEYNGDIKLVMDDIVADAKSILSIMMLAAEKGKEIEIRVNNCGDDKAVLEKMKKLFEDGFGED